MLIVDAHEDIAWNALTFGRNYTRSALATREAERGGEAPQHNGHTLLGLPEWMLGRVALIFATLFSAPVRRRQGAWDVLVYSSATEAEANAIRQMDFYTRLGDEYPQFTLVRTSADLEAVLATWTPDGDIARRRIGLILLMEGADQIREPKAVEAWFERGVRIVGPAWAGTRYAGGTGEPGPLTAEGRALLDAMADLGMILDLSHASEPAYFESLDRFGGVVIASHANPRALAVGKYPDRALTDEQIRRLAEHDGVVGVVPYNRFLKTGWTVRDGKSAVPLATVAAAIDHICQVTGSARHAGLGSDFDGGFGVEHTPEGIDTVADLAKVAEALREQGFAEAEVEAVMSGNWLRLLRRGLPE